MRRLLLIVLLVAALAPAGAAFAGAEHVKFTFTGQTFSDGTQNGVITVGAKKTGGGSTTVVCDYYTEGFQTYLGQFQSMDPADFSTDAETLREFCLANYENRVP